MKRIVSRPLERWVLGFLVFAAVLGAAAAKTFADAPKYQYTVGTDTVLDRKTGLTWQRAASSSQYNLGAAVAYCSSLSLAGFSSGWRLPTRHELESLVDRKVAPPGPTIDKTAFPNTPASRFWTATPYESGWGFDVNFMDGSMHPEQGGYAFYARCVR
ncbi:MAG TPA: DUF1566 domain-containing protein [Myxococcales bacterium]|jgi:hypothetical protein